MKLTTPPPPPSPPRKPTSGFAPRSSAFLETTGNAFAAETVRFEEPLTSDRNSNGEPSTLNRGPRAVEREIEREQVLASPRSRADGMPGSSEDETQARRVDHGLLDPMRRDGVPVRASADLAVKYDALPSLEVRRPYDSFEEQFEEHDPVTQLHGALQQARRAKAERAASYREQRQEPSYKEPSYRERPQEERSYENAVYSRPEPSYQAPSFPAQSEAANEEEVWGRREESGPRSRPLPPTARPLAASPSYNDINDSSRWSRDHGAQPPTGWSAPPERRTKQGLGSAEQAVVNEALEARIPPPARVPHEMRPAFVEGVQPLRRPTPDAWSPEARVAQAPQQHPSPMPMHAANNASHYPAPAHPQYAQHPPYHPYAYAAPPPNAPYYGGPQYAPGPYPQHPAHLYVPPPPHAMQQHMHTGQSQSVGHTRSAASARKIGRFAWFVAGCAFGITFAFFATGFLNGGKTAKEDFPAPAPLPTLTAPAVATAAPPPPVPVPAVLTPAALPAAVAAPPVAAAAPAPVAPAVAPAPPGVIAPPAPAAPAAPAAVVAPVPAKVAAPSRRAPRRSVASAPASSPKDTDGDDEAPAPARAPARAPAASGGADVSDLLGAGLKP